MNRITLLLACLAFCTATTSAQSDCLPPLDFNQDGTIGSPDLLNLLGLYGNSDMDFDGIWDSEDDCVLDACGVCDGNGPSVPVVDGIITLYDSVYAPQIDEWIVFEAGQDTTFILVCPVPGCTDTLALNYDPEANVDDGTCLPPWSCGDPWSYFGHDYATTLIGDQCWFAENLRTTQYADSTTIPEPSSFTDWTASEGRVTHYGAPWGSNMPSCTESSPGINACNPAQSLPAYGRMYEFDAVTDSRSICPTGWHVPTLTEWETLLEAADGYFGGQLLSLKSQDGWTTNLGNTNSTGFSAVPSGTLAWGASAVQYFGAGDMAEFWTSTLIPVSPGTASSIRIWGDNSPVEWNFQPNSAGSVRCLLD